MERTAKKLIPIYKALKDKIVKGADIVSPGHKFEHVTEPNPEADMRHILGFLNQSEWVTSLNIGNIM